MFLSYPVYGFGCGHLLGLIHSLELECWSWYCVFYWFANGSHSYCIMGAEGIICVLCLPLPKTLTDQWTINPGFLSK